MKTALLCLSLAGLGAAFQTRTWMDDCGMMCGVGGWWAGICLFHSLGESKRPIPID